MRKSILLAVLSIALMLTASTAFAFSLAELGPVEMKFKNWEQFVPGFPGPLGFNLNDGKTDIYGIVRMTSIENLSGDPLWQQGVSGEYITGVFYGLDMASGVAGITNDGRYSDNASFAGGAPQAFLNLYIDTVAPGDPADPGGAGATEIESLDTTLPGGQEPDIDNTYIDGTLFLSLQFVPGIVPMASEFAGALPTVMQSSSSSLTVPFSGTGFSYLDVVGGTYAWMFDTNGFNPDPTGYNHTSDIFMRSNLTAPGEFGWNMKSDDPARGNAVPEPASMLLLGSGLIGLAGYSRRKFRKKE